MTNPNSRMTQVELHSQALTVEYLTLAALTMIDDDPTELSEIIQMAADRAKKLCNALDSVNPLEVAS